MSRPRISPSLRRQIAEEAHHRCGYCLAEESFTGVPLTIDHLLPLALGGSNRRENLWLACRPCNEFKRTQVRAADPESTELVALFNPRTQSWTEHFRLNPDATIVGLTPIGRATVQALQLNRLMLVSARRRWLFVGWRPLDEQD